MFDKLKGKQDVDGKIGTTIVIAVQYCKGCFVNLAKNMFIKEGRPRLSTGASLGGFISHRH